MQNSLMIWENNPFIEKASKDKRKSIKIGEITLIQYIGALAR